MLPFLAVVPSDGALERNPLVPCPAPCAIPVGYLLLAHHQNENDPAIMGPRAGRPAGPGGALAGAGPYSAVMVSR